MTKIAIITGGSRGIGKATAIKLAASGINSIITYNTGIEDANNTVIEIEKYGAQSVAVQLDVSNPDSFMNISEIIEPALKELGAEKFDFLINNAGIGLYKKFGEFTENDFDKLTNIHLKSVFFISQKLLPLIKDGGQIINISSGLTRMSLDGYSLYATLKTGIEGLTRYMAKELGSRQIRTNTIAPSAIETDFGGGAVRDNKDLNDYIANATALGRVGQVNDIAGAINSLLSDDSLWINGQRIEVSGGQWV